VIEKGNVDRTKPIPSNVFTNLSPLMDSFDLIVFWKKNIHMINEYPPILVMDMCRFKPLDPGILESTLPFRPDRDLVLLFDMDRVGK